MRPELSYRLEIEEELRLNRAVDMAIKGDPINKIVETLLPLLQEVGVGSAELGVTGRIDQLYKMGDTLIPADFKTHTDRFDTFIWKDAFREQLILYAILVEKQYRGAKVDNAIIEFTDDLTSHKFKITKNDKKNAIKHISQAREVLESNKVPPKLSGSDSIKCSKCYYRDHCFSFEKEDK
jgi:CRISPR-associated protein Cas4